MTMPTAALCGRCEAVTWWVEHPEGWRCSGCSATVSSLQQTLAGAER